MRIVSFRPPEAWRGTGILFNPGLWTVMRKRSTSRGTWFRMRRVQDGTEVWVGSLYVPPSSPTRKHATVLASHLTPGVLGRRHQCPDAMACTRR